MKRRQLPDQSNGPPRRARGNTFGSGYHSNGKSNGHDTPSAPRGPVVKSRATMEWLDRMSDEYTQYYRSSSAPVSAFKPHFPEMVFQLRLLGSSNRMIANACNVSENTITVWSQEGPKQIPAFAEAMQRGGEMADARVAESMYHRAIGYSHEDVKIMATKDDGIVSVPIVKHYPPDATAGQFWLTNRARDRWANRQSTELTGPNGDALVPPQLLIQPVKVK